MAKAPLRVRRTEAQLPAEEEAVKVPSGPVPEGCCPSCSGTLEAGAVLCIRCGYDLRSGKKIKTQVEMGPSRVGAKAGGKAVKSDDDFAHLVVPPLMLVIFVGIVVASILLAKTRPSKDELERKKADQQLAIDYREKREELDRTYRSYLRGKPKSLLILPADVTKLAPVLVILGSSEMPASALAGLAPSACAIFRIEAPGEDQDRAWSEDWDEDAHVVGQELQRMLGQKKFVAGPVILAGLGQGGAAALEIAARDPQAYSLAVAADPLSIRPMLDDIDEMDHKKQKFAILESPNTASAASDYRASAEDDLGLKIPAAKLEKPADAATLLETALKLQNRK